MESALKIKHNLDAQFECGTDEVGRGCLAGPVVAAAVILPDDFYHEKLNDSKKMSPKNRDLVYDYIIEHAVAYGIAAASVKEIERVNILQASITAMHASIRLMKIQPDFILADGNQFNPFMAYDENEIVGDFKGAVKLIPHECIIKGDSKYASIAAASVLAKVSRDRLMKKLAEKHPGYGWETNAGYGTKQHIDAIKETGINEWHRVSFLSGIINQPTKLI
jgi:ribonuclease HII